MFQRVGTEIAEDGCPDAQFNLAKNLLNKPCGKHNHNTLISKNTEKKLLYSMLRIIIVHRFFGRRNRKCERRRLLVATSFRTRTYRSD